MSNIKRLTPKAVKGNKADHLLVQAYKGCCTESNKFPKKIKCLLNESRVIDIL